MHNHIPVIKGQLYCCANERRLYVNDPDNVNEPLKNIGYIPAYVPFIALNEKQVRTPNGGYYRVNILTTDGRLGWIEVDLNYWGNPSAKLMRWDQVNDEQEENESQ